MIEPTSLLVHIGPHSPDVVSLVVGLIVGVVAALVGGRRFSSKSSRDSGTKWIRPPN